MEQEIQNLKQNMRGVMTIVLIMVIVALGAYTYKTLRETEYLSGSVANINVQGQGEVLAKPDIATFSFSVQSEGDDAATAQDKSAKATNNIVNYLKEQGIDEQDIKTLSYNLSPHYEYVSSVCNTEGLCPPGQRVLRGYDVNQTIQVKVHSIDKAGSLISGVGTHGATNVSSLQLTIDNEDTYKAQAREKAIADAKSKAKKLADDLGVHLVRITSFNENSGGVPIMYRAEASGIGGATDTNATAPSIPTGQNTFDSNVNLTYEIR